MLTPLQQGAAQQPDYYTGILAKHQISAFLDLQQAIKPTLAQPHHLKPRTKEDLESHIDHGGLIVAAYDRGHTLVGSTILTDRNSAYAKNLHDYPSAGEDSQTIVMQSFCIHPDHKKKGIARLMENTAREFYPDAVFMAKVALDNQCSMESFTKRGFQEICTATSVARETGQPYLAAYLEKRPEPAPALELLQGGIAGDGETRHFSL